MNEAILQQAIGRTRRIGQLRVVKIYEYQVPESFNLGRLLKNMKKSLGGMATELSSLIFKFDDATEGVLVSLGVRALNDNTRDLAAFPAVKDIPAGYTEVAKDQVPNLVMELLQR